MDRLELRRKNFISEFPFTLASGLTVDSGDYHASLDKLLEVLDLDGLRAEQETRRENGVAKQLGVGFSTYNEMCGLAPSRILGAIRYAVGGWDQATIRVHPTGSIQVVTGTSPHGQGHETAWSQIVADQLGCEIGEVEVLHGDTAVSSIGMDSYGSRSLPVGGVALCYAADKIIDKARELAAHELEVSPDDLEYADGSFTVKGSPDKERTIKAIAFTAWSAHNLPDGMEPGLEATAVYDPPNFSWPAGAHAAVVEVDTETGDARRDALRRKPLADVDDVTVEEVVAVRRTVELDGLRHVDQPHLVLPPQEVVGGEVSVHPPGFDDQRERGEELLPRVVDRTRGQTRLGEPRRGTAVVAEVLEQDRAGAIRRHGIGDGHAHVPPGREHVELVADPSLTDDLPSSTGHLGDRAPVAGVSSGA